MAVVFTFAMMTNPVFAASPHLTVTGKGIDGSGDPFATVRGTAGATQPDEAGDVYAFVFVTNVGIFAIASHDFCDSVEQLLCEPGPDPTWHGHKLAIKSVTEGKKTYDCLDIPNVTDEGVASLSGNRVTLTGTSATTIVAVDVVKLTTLDSGEVCIKKVISSV